MSKGFPPVIGSASRVLILGSLPGDRSIRAQQYYAHPRNSFWRIAGEITGIDPVMAYDKRCAGIVQCGLALWDVLAASVRPGSLDSAIDMESAKINNFNGLLDEFPGVRCLCFNGLTARRVFDRRVACQLDPARIPQLITLPSTSPAYAAMPFEEKLQRWSVIDQYLH